MQLGDLHLLRNDTAYMERAGDFTRRFADADVIALKASTRCGRSFGRAGAGMPTAVVAA